MLKIKDDKWKEFCDNAENLGFGNLWYDQPIFIYPNVDIKEKDSLVLFDVTYDELNMQDKLLQKDSEIALDKIFDLFELGYIEKVEVQ